MMRKCTVCSRIKYIAILFLLFPLYPSHSQDKKPGQDTRDKDRLTFKLPVNLVVVNATVVDKNGNPVRDLVQSDFKIYEDGKLQPIQTFAMESYGPAQPEGSAPPDSSSVAGNARLLQRGIRPRMISILIDDMTASAWEYFPMAIKAVTKYIEEDALAEDQVAISAASGRVQFPFSNDRQVLLNEVKTVLGKLNMDRLTKEDCPTLTDLQAQKIAERYADDQSLAEFDFRVALEETLLCLSLDPKDAGSVRTAKAHMRTAASRQTQEAEYRSSTFLHSLRAHLRSLRHFDAAKSLIIFSDGFLSEGISHVSYEIQDVVDQALASSVVLNTVDVRGLYTPVLPASERATPTSSSAGAYKQILYMDDMSAQEAPLAQMANETGGLFSHNSNDLYAGVRKIADRQSTYYVLTYAMPSQKSDGRYHKIKLEVARPGLELVYRKGYYAPKEELTFERRKKEDIMEAFRAPGNLNEIPIGLAYNYYQEDASTYVLALSTNVSIRGLHFLDEDSRRKNLINLVVAAFDEMDHYVEGIEKSIDFKLTEASYANILTYGINSKVEFKLPMGRYKIKAVVREGTEGKMGSATRTVEIP
jgi:VWFA-related protein